MNDPLRVRFSGPMAVHADDFRAELAARGYTQGSAAPQLQLVAQLSCWMQVRNLDVGGLTAGREAASARARTAFRTRYVRLTRTRTSVPGVKVS